MLKINLLLSVFFLFSACSKSERPKLMISSYENETSSRIVERTLANAPDGQCLKNIFSVEVLKAEVKELEKNISGSPVSGKWKHLKLADLPLPQANFLKRYGDKLGDQTGKNPIDFSSCQDVPCLYNKIYGKDEDVAGYVHYLWYLKFNHMLSADNHVPTQDISSAGIYQGKTHPLSAYLYNRDELYGLWRLSLMLKTSHNKIGLLKEIQRIPRGESLEGRNALACGVAYGAGHVLLQDGCLTVYKQDVDTGHLYGAVAHELSHMLDFGLSSHSESETYKKLTGFSVRTYLNEKKETVREWVLDPNFKHISGYAKTSPAESFAETMAYMRTDGEDTKANIDENLKAHISGKFYSGNRFERQHLMESWLKKNSIDLSKETLKAVVDCTSEKAPTLTSNFFKTSDFDTKIMPSTLSCLGAKAKDISKLLGARVSIEEPEGCRNLGSHGAKTWEELSRKSLSSYLGKFLKELEADKNYVARINTFYDELSNKESARLAYLNCYGEADEEICYENEIEKLSMEKATLLRLPEIHTQELVDLYASYHAFSNTKEELGSLYLKFIESQRAAIRKKASTLFKTCLDLPHSDDLPPQDILFKMGEGYLISSVYNCLSGNLPEAIREIVREVTVGDLKITHPKEEIILYKETSPLLKYELETIYEANLQKEKMVALAQSETLKIDIRSALLRNFDWVSDILDSKKIAESCSLQAMKLISFPPVYHLKKDLFANVISSSICTGIENSNEYSSYLEASKTTLIKKSQDSMENKLYELALGRVHKCIEQFPVDTNLNRVKFKKDRENCLVSLWPQMEKEVLKGFADQPLAKKFNLSDQIFIDRFNLTRRKMQLKIFKDHFQGP